MVNDIGFSIWYSSSCNASLQKLVCFNKNILVVYQQWLEKKSKMFSDKTCDHIKKHSHEMF